MIIDFVSFSPGLKNPLEFMTDPNIQPPLAGLASCFVGTQYLAKLVNYPSRTKNCRYDPQITERLPRRRSRWTAKKGTLNTGERLQNHQGRDF